ncbi:response regulator [bacterium]|nr:response regulator [candidate division CSSED10-310 bacterium]
MGVKLLLADNSKTIRKAIQISFRKTDTQVAFADDQRQLFSVVKTLHPDVIVLSATLPGVNLQQDIKSLSQDSGNWNIPVLLLSERGSGYDSQAISSLGAVGFLYKPLDDRELKQLLAEILEPEQPSVQEMETRTQQAVTTKAKPEKKSDIPKTAAEVIPELRPSDFGSPEQRAQVLMEILESYLNENIVLFTDALAKNLAPKIAPEVAGKIIESIDFSNLPFKIATIVEGIIQDLVPQMAEELISRELDKIKEEAARLIDSDDGEQT